jgi:hypothetical protein
MADSTLALPTDTLRILDNWATFLRNQGHKRGGNVPSSKRSIVIALVEEQLIDRMVASPELRAYMACVCPGLVAQAQEQAAQVQAAQTLSGPE